MADVSATAHRRDRLAFWALAGIALFVTHDVIYLVQIGPGQSLVEALRTAGHGYWGWASVALVAVGTVAGVSAWMRLRRLRRRAAALRAAPTSSRAFPTRFARGWWRLAAVVAVGFVLQENVEHVITHGHAPGVGVLLGPEHPLALPVIGLIGAITAVLAALVSRAEEALVIAIAAALRRAIRAPLAGRRPPARPAAAMGSILAHPGASRAPPVLVPASA